MLLVQQSGTSDKHYNLFMLYLYLKYQYTLRPMSLSYVYFTLSHIHMYKMYNTEYNN